MLCSVCKKNESDYHIKNNINGVITDRYICKDCYDKLFSKAYMSSFPRLITMLYGGESAKDKTERKCSQCGTKLSEVLNTMYVGCPACYRDMYDYITPAIKNIQNAVMHEGKRPLETQESISDEYERLKNELSRSIAEENYEQAAIISARLKQLRGESHE